MTEINPVSAIATISGVASERKQNPRFLRANRLMHRKTTATRIWQASYILRGRVPVTTTTLIVLSVVITLFAVFVGALAWAQQHARQLTTAPVDTPRPRRRPF